MKIYRFKFGMLGGIYGLNMKEIKQKQKNSLKKLGLERKNKMVELHWVGAN